MADAANKLHFHLASGIVMIRVPDSEQPEGPGGEQVHAIMSIPVGAVFRTKTGNVGVKELGNAQVNMQMVMHNKIGGEVPPEVVDVVLQSISHLGYMTEEEFGAPPTGAQQQEVKASRAETDPFKVN